MSPHKLPYLLYGEHQGETRVYLGGNISPDIDDIQVCKQLLNNLVSEFKQQHGLELIHLASCIKGKGANAYGMQKFGFGKLFRLFCKKCSNVKCHSIVIKGSFPSKEAFIENGRVGYLRVNQVWFHTKSCRKPDHEENNYYAAVPETLSREDDRPCLNIAKCDGGSGFDIFKHPGGKKGFIGTAFDPMVAKLKKWNRPHVGAPSDAVDINVDCLGPWPPSDERVQFDNEDLIADNRQQNHIPSETHEELSTNEVQQQVVKMMYTLICQNDLVSEFTRYRPHRNPTAVPDFDPRQGDKFPCIPSGHVHLYFVMGKYLNGAMQLNRSKTKALVPPNEAYLHQIVHCDEMHPDRFEISGYAGNPTMKGLNKPGAWNIPVETTCPIYMMNPTFVETAHAEDGEALFVSANADHGGMSYIHNPNKDVDWKGRVHLAIHSIRHRYVEGAVGITTSQDTYCPPQHMRLLKQREATKALKRTEYELRVLYHACKDFTGLDTKTKSIMAKYKTAVGKTAPKGLIKPARSSPDNDSDASDDDAAAESDTNEVADVHMAVGVAQLPASDAVGGTNSGPGGKRAREKDEKKKAARGRKKNQKSRS